MPDDPSTQSDPRIETGSRARELPQEAHIRKRFEKFQDFIDMYRSRISLGGAFVDSQTLHPVGAEIYLDFRLEDGYRLLYGLGEVVWVRLVTMSDERPKGMGLRFLSLDEGGRELVLKLLEEQVKSGGAPFEVDRVPEDGSIDPTVVQALAGPSAEENEAAAKARTGSRPAAKPEPDPEEADEELPDLPPGVLPPPDDEPDFSAPWGEQLPEIPDDLLEESATGAGAGGQFLPSVEAPESPYAPGSDSPGSESPGSDSPGSDSHDEEAQAEIAFEAPPYDGDPHLDETDFGASAWSTSPDSPSAAEAPPAVKPVGDATNLLQARGGDPFSDFDGDSVPEVDGTLFQLPDSSPAPAMPEPAVTEPALTETAPDTGPTFDAPSFSGDVGASFDAGFDADSDAFEVDFGDEEDETGSQVAPPPDIGDEVGSAWVEEPDTESAQQEPAPQESAAMDAALDIGSDEDDFAFEPPPEDVLSSVDEALVTDHDFEASFDDVPEDEVAQRPDDRADIATPAAIAAAALAHEMHDEEAPPPQSFASSPERSFSSTETADDLFAFRGPADAQPALDPEETASLRKGTLLPDLSETMMGTKAAGGEETGGLHHSYDDWHEWAPHPTKSSGKSKILIGVLVLLLLAVGAGYTFRDTLLPLVGLGGGGTGPVDSASLNQSAGSEDSSEMPDAQQDDTLQDDPLAEPIVVAEPDSGDAEPSTDTLADEFGTTAPSPPPQQAPSPPVTQTAKPPTTASAESLRPPSTRPASTPSTGRPATRVEGIDVRPGSGATEVIVRFDGDIAPARYQHDKLTWAADKEMLKLLGMENFKQTQISGDGTRLRQVRVGFHPGNELHLVFDLASDAVSIQGIEVRGNQLVIKLSS